MKCLDSTKSKWDTDFHFWDFFPMCKVIKIMPADLNIKHCFKVYKPYHVMLQYNNLLFHACVWGKWGHKIFHANGWADLPGFNSLILSLQHCKYFQQWKASIWRLSYSFYKCLTVSFLQKNDHGSGRDVGWCLFRHEVMQTETKSFRPLRYISPNLCSEQRQAFKIRHYAGIGNKN